MITKEPSVSQKTWQQQLQHKINNKTKPLGALGRLEQIALQVGMIQQTDQPTISKPHIVVFAGDHGIAAQGEVNPYPQEVTAQMVLNFLGGGAAINVFCRQHNIHLKVVDAGVNFNFVPEAIENSSKTFINAKISFGTLNYLEGEAMSEDEMIRAISSGREIVSRIHAEGCNCIGFGEMGIGNTSSAALIMSMITGLPVQDCVGRGTGANDEQLAKKIEVLKRVSNKHSASIETGTDNKAKAILRCFGGFEIAMMVGAYLEAVANNMVIVVDGFIATAALLLAKEIDNTIQDNCIFAHTSGEQGHEKMLNYLDAKALLQLGMRLGEGTGSALAIPLIVSAVNFLNEMASFESAGVSRS